MRVRQKTGEVSAARIRSWKLGNSSRVEGEGLHLEQGVSKRVSDGNLFWKGGWKNLTVFQLPLISRIEVERYVARKQRAGRKKTTVQRYCFTVNFRKPEACSQRSGHQAQEQEGGQDEKAGKLRFPFAGMLVASPESSSSGHIRFSTTRTVNY